MKSITIHNLEDDLTDAIQKMSIQIGLSQNEVIRKLLRQALNLSGDYNSKKDFSSFRGLWNKKEGNDFNDAISIFEKIDEEIWE